MTDQRVQFLLTKTHKDTSFVPDTFQLRTNRPMVWLQKIIFYVLRKLECYAIQYNLRIERVALSPEKLLTSLLRQRQELVMTYHQYGERLLIGPEEFRELAESAWPQTQITYPVSFELKYNWYPNGEQGYYQDEEMRAGHGYQVCGMKVTIVPWMKGILVVPKEFD